MVRKLEKILFLGTPLERNCGVSKVLLELSSALEEKGIEVDHLSGWPGKTDHTFVSNNGLTQKINGLEGFLEFAQSSRLKYDVLHSHSWAWAPISCPDGEGIVDLKKHFESGTVHTFHSYLPIEEEAQRSILPHADKIIHLTPQGEATFCDIFRDSPEYFPKIRVLPNLVKVEKLREEEIIQAQKQISPSEERVILYVGRFAPEKGTILLAEAYQRIQNEHPGTNFVFVGDETTSSRGEKARVIKAIGGDKDHVIFTGWVGEREVAAYQEATKRAGGIQMAPSYYEAFHLGIAKGLARGCPIAVSYIPTLRGIYNLDGIIPYGIPIKEISAKGISQAFDFFIENQGPTIESTSVGKKAIRKKYSTSKVINQYISVYREVLK